MAHYLIKDDTMGVKRERKTKHITSMEDVRAIKSVAPMPRGAPGVDSVTKNGWTVKNKPGVFRMIDKEEIQVDHTYQRQPSTNANAISRIAKSWNWLAFNTITVALREGVYYAVDGQHRLIAALKRGDITKIPCMVFQSENMQQEAASFFDINQGRQALRAYEKFRANVAAGEDNALFVQAICNKLDLVITDNKEINGNHVRCVYALCTHALKDRGCFEKVMAFIKKLCGEDSIISVKRVHGIFFLHNNCGEGLDDTRLATRLLDVEAENLLLGARRAENYLQKNGDRSIAIGFLDMVNSGLRKKFAFDS